MRDADSGVYITVDSISETPEPHPPRFTIPFTKHKIGEGGGQRTCRHRTCGGGARGLVRSYSTAVAAR